MVRTFRLGHVGLVVAAALLAVLLTPTGSAAANNLATEQASRGACPATSIVSTHSYPPLRVDPLAAYPMWWLKGGPGTGTDHLGLVVEADFPYAAWTSWTTYKLTGTFPAVNVLPRSSVVPDSGSVNPYVTGNPVMAPRRHFRILVVPEGTDGGRLPDGSMIANGLQGIGNRLFRDTDVDWALFERVYAPFPGYDRIGRGGPTATPPPKVTAVDLTTGATLDCAASSTLPAALVRAPGQLGQVDNAIPTLIAATNLDKFKDVGLRQFYPPKPNPKLVQFFRPGFSAVPFPEMPSYPSSEQCGNLLGAKLDPNQIAMIRIPKMPTFFDATKVGPNTTYPAPDVEFVSINNYGFDLGLQLPDSGNPFNMSLSQAATKLDSTGGMTLVIFPRRGTASLPSSVALIIAKARANGWNLQQGSIDGPVYPNSEVIRYKGTNPNYSGSFVANDASRGVPCFYDDPANANVPFEDIPESYAARPDQIGAAAPQGVQCSLSEYLNDSCLKRLKKHIADTGGTYYAS